MGDDRANKFFSLDILFNKKDLYFDVYTNVPFYSGVIM